MMETGKQVLLGMSGGTDSSVALMLLQDAGYEVTGVTFRFYEYGDSTEYLDDACYLAKKLGITHIIYDARKIFREKVIDYFIKEYMSGRTPVPCIVCNNYLKWPLLAKIADEKGIFHISTGHYIRKEMINNNFYVTCGTDSDKDQSFFLWGLSQDIISRMVLPLGKLTKKEVRNIAAEKGFLKVATKKDSIGVCFCPMDYHSFLKQELQDTDFMPGDFVDENDCFIAKHKGYPFYTIGQRRGLGIDLNRAVFVKDIIPEKNRIVLGDLRSLEQNDFYLKDWNIVAEEELLYRDDIIVKIRYRKQSNLCRVIPVGDKLHVQLREPLTAIAPGQAAAFYREDRVLGGGIICTFNENVH